MRRAADDARRTFERRIVRANGERKPRLQQGAALMPVDLGAEFDARRVRPKPHVLHDLAVMEAAANADGGAMRPILDDLDLARRNLLAAAQVVVLDVPRIPVTRLVAVSPDLVAAIGERLAIRALVEQA